MFDAQTTLQPDRVAADLEIIQIKQLFKSYHTPAGAVPALRGLDLTVAAGEFVAVVGKSGAGKSTLVNMITGIDQPDSGEIIITGTEVHTLTEDDLARWRGLNLGVVFQFFQLLPSINLIKNVTIPMEFCGVYSPKERRERALDILEQVGLGEHVHKRPSEISGGQQQRVAIARALANDPPILVADEPTGNLDSHSAHDVLGVLQALSRDAGKTVIMVTHDPKAAAFGSRQIHLEKGELI
jgi:putative ABC transport system ATP-binding protein